ncbi:MAG: hypothetical protein Q9215_005534 [Flavoplaca cf. flavocitrina]
MPDGQRGEPEFAIHSHQPFAQSWVLAGQGTHRGYEVQVFNDPPLATHAEYALVRNDGKATSTSYETHQVSSTVTNTRKFVCAKPIRSDIHTRDDTYTIPAATFHTTEVEPDEFHATLVYFDSRRGFEPNARVLGPKDAEFSTQIGDPNGLTAGILAETTNVLRSYERHMWQGQQHLDRSEWEYALKEYDIALSTIRSINLSDELAHYAHLTLGAFGIANRHLGRYQTAKKYLEQALKETKPSHALINISAELGIIYRDMDLLEEAKGASEVQYETALKLGSERGVCRALGNLGTVNFQLFQRSHDENLLELAIEQQTQRVERARLITASVNAQDTDRKTRAKNAKYSIKQESMGLARLSICYTALGKLAEARQKAKESLDLTYDSDDPIQIAIYHYYYGRTLLKSDQKEEALKHFNVSTIFSPAHILCLEPSEEHRGYLRELIAAGADIDREDMRGYTPWDYTIFNGDEKTQNIIRDALRRILPGDVEQQLAQRQKDANVKKAYRELFQEYLRPVLLKGGDEVFQTLRTLYAEALAIDQEKKTLYDGFKFVWYRDFLNIGRLPRSTDDLTNEYTIGTGASRNSMPESVVFFSYRWINHDPKVSSPDDSQHTQYKRMIAALEEFLKINPETDRNKLGIWIVSRSLCFYCTVIWTAILTPSTQDLACIDQDNPESGVRALPLNLAQCNSVITLADQDYESRAWCSVEALLAHTLRNSYHQHTWYEQVPIRVAKDDQAAFRLQQGQFNTTIPMSEKRLQFEEVDRPKVVFLERQSHLLANN